MNVSMLPVTNQNQALVLTKALINMASFYELTGKELGDIIGISESGVTRLYQGKKILSPETKEGELAILLLRVYRSLNAMLGNDHTKAKIWLNSPNTYFNATPCDSIKTIPGLVKVVQYLDGSGCRLVQAQDADHRPRAGARPP